MEQLRVAHGAIQALLDFCRDGANETGGLMVGIAQPPTVLAVGGPGPKAVRSPTTFTSDPQHDGQFLQSQRQKFGQPVTGLGYWHKHTVELSRPSLADFHQARKLLADLQDKGDSSSWLLITIVCQTGNSEPVIQPFYLSLDTPDFVPWPFVVVADDASALRDALKTEPTDSASNRSTDFWTDLDFQFQDTQRGRQKLRDDELTLKDAGYTVQILERRRDRRVALVVERGEKQFLCVLPPEYPLGMPRLFILPEMAEVFPLLSRPVWNSTMTVADLIKNLLRSVPTSIDTTRVGTVPTESATPQQTDTRATRYREKHQVVVKRKRGRPPKLISMQKKKRSRG